METNILPQPRSLVPYFIMWSGQVVSLIGRSVAPFALIWWLTKSTNSGLVLAIATTLQFLPMIVLGPVVGVYVDRLNRRRVMMAAEGVIALAALVLALLFARGAAGVAPVCVFIFVLSTAGVFHWTAVQASTALMVPEQHLPRIAGLNQMLVGLQNVAGPPLGAILYYLLPLQHILLINVAAATAAISLLLYIHIPQPVRASGPAAAAERTLTAVWREAQEGFRYILGWPGFILLTTMTALTNFTAMPTISFLPLLVEHHFHGGALELGWMRAAWNGGMVAGGLLLGAWGGFRRRIFTTLGACTGLGLGLLFTGLAPGSMFWLAWAAYLVAGVMISFSNGPVFAILQKTVEPALQGRVITAYVSLCGVTTPIGLLTAGALSATMDVRLWYVIAGLMYIVLFCGAFFVPAVVTIEQQTGAAPLPAAEAAPSR